VLCQQGLGLEQSSNIGEGLKMMKELSVADFTACIHLQVDNCSLLRKSRQMGIVCWFGGGRGERG